MWGMTSFEGVKDLSIHGRVTGVIEVYVREPLEHLHMSSTLIVSSQSIVMFDDVISSDKLVIHGYEVVNVNVYQVIVSQVVHHSLCPTNL